MNYDQIQAKLALGSRELNQEGPDICFFVVNIFHRGSYSPSFEKQLDQRGGCPIASQGGSMSEFLRKLIATYDFCP